VKLSASIPHLRLKKTVNWSWKAKKTEPKGVNLWALIPHLHHETNKIEVGKPRNWTYKCKILSINPSFASRNQQKKFESQEIEPEHVKLPSFASRNQSNKAVYLILSRIHPPKIVHPNSKQFNSHCQRPKKLQSKTPNPRTATVP
jgi:hypothetical protein